MNILDHEAKVATKSKNLRDYLCPSNHSLKRKKWLPFFDGLTSNKEPIELKTEAQNSVSLQASKQLIEDVIDGKILQSETVLLLKFWKRKTGWAYRPTRQ